jgi:hypothetical protein
MSLEGTARPAAGERRRALRELGIFFGLAYAITWGLGAAIIFARPGLEALVGPLGVINHHWLYYLAVTAPTLSAVACCLMFGGWPGLKALAARLVRPAKLLWVVTAILIWPFALTAWALAMDGLGRGGGIDLRAIWIGAPVLATTTWVLVIDPGGLGEEIGWRGYAMPRLAGLMPPAWAAVFLGLVWGLWHLPAFFVSGLAQSQFDLGWFLLGSVCLSLVMAWLFVHANGNVLIAGVIPHLIWNLAFDAQVFRRDALQQEVTVMALLAAALLILLGPGLKGWRKAAAEPVVL